MRAALGWMKRGDRGVWPSVESSTLDVRLSPPGVLEAEARLELSGLSGASFGLLLNRALRVTAAVDGEGRKLFVLHGFGLPPPHHAEARLVLFFLPEAPARGRATVHLRYAGSGETGTQGPDWRGILLVDDGHVRMTEQSVFYPAVPLSSRGPAIERTATVLRVLAPPDFEVAAPGRRTEARPSWTFESTRPGVLCLVAGRYARHDSTRDALSTVVLLLPEHAERAPAIAEEVHGIHRYYRDWLGAIDAGPPTPVTVVEIECRPGSSYNWASEGVIAVDRRTLRAELPFRLLAHELAHLWWGIGVRSEGAGERFLTESTSEYAAWRCLEQRRGPEALTAAEDAARERVASLRGRGHDAPLSAVTSRSPSYADLVHAKGPLALRRLEESVGRDALDAALRAFVRRHRDGVATLEAFLSEVRRAAAGAEPDVEGIVR